MEDSSSMAPKEMYEMGKRLCQMAEEMGYTEGEGEEEIEAAPMEPDTEEPAMPSPSGKSKLDIAMGFLK